MGISFFSLSWRTKGIAADSSPLRSRDNTSSSQFSGSRGEAGQVLPLPDAACWISWSLPGNVISKSFSPPGALFMRWKKMVRQLQAAPVIMLRMRLAVWGHMAPCTSVPWRGRSCTHPCACLFPSCYCPSVLGWITSSISAAAKGHNCVGPCCLEKIIADISLPGLGLHPGSPTAPPALRVVSRSSQQCQEHVMNSHAAWACPRHIHISTSVSAWGRIPVLELTFRTLCSPSASETSTTKLLSPSLLQGEGIFW